MDKNKFNYYQLFFESIGDDTVYLGELYGMSHEDAKKLHDTFLASGFYDYEE